MQETVAYLLPLNNSVAFLIGFKTLASSSKMVNTSHVGIRVRSLLFSVSTAQTATLCSNILSIMGIAEKQPFWLTLFSLIK